MASVTETLFPCFFRTPDHSGRLLSDEGSKKTEQKTKEVFEDRVCWGWTERSRIGEHGLKETQCCCCWITCPTGIYTYGRSVSSAQMR